MTLRRSKRACTKTWQKHPWWKHPWCTQLLKRHELSSNWTANCRACRVSAKSLGSAMWKSAVAGKRSASCRCASMVARHGDDVTSVRVTRRHASAMSALVGTCSAWIEIKSWQSQLRNTESHMMSSQMIPRSSFFHPMTPWSLLSRSVVLQLFDGAAVGAASFAALPQMHRRCWTLLDPVGPCLRFDDINFLSRIDLLSGPLANHLMPGQHIQHQETSQTHVAMVKTCENMLQKVGIGPNSERWMLACKLFPSFPCSSWWFRDFLFWCLCCIMLLCCRNHL